MRRCQAKRLYSDSKKIDFAAALSQDFRCIPRNFPPWQEKFTRSSSIADGGAKPTFIRPSFYKHLVRGSFRRNSKGERTLLPLVLITLIYDALSVPSSCVHPLTCSCEPIEFIVSPSTTVLPSVNVCFRPSCNRRFQQCSSDINSTHLKATIALKRIA